MAQVYMAVDTLLGRTVALKILRQATPSQLIRFMKEARFQARLDHPHLCKVYDVELSGQTPRIAMQLLRGGTLGEAAPTLDWQAIVELMSKVAEAIHTAHQVGLIHRDIKPSNILLEPALDGRLEPYVCDFGLVKDLSEDGGTLSRVPLGTPMFMAPEQFRGDSSAISPATDIWGMGATLIAALTGKPPQPESGGPEALALSKDRPIPPSRLRTGLPPDMDLITGKCLETNPEDRYTSAAVLAEDLRRLLRGEPLIARPLGLILRIKRILRRNPKVAALVFSASLAACTVVTVSIQQIWKARRQTELAQRLALEINGLQQFLRLERMRPVHELGPAYLRVHRELADLRTRISTWGSVAEGPGNLAMGQAYYAAGEYEQALKSFESAWDSGFRTPDLAYALGRVHCDLFWKADRELGYKAQAIDLKLSRARHLDPAKALMAQATEQSFEPRELAEARICRLREDLQGALSHARKASLDNPWDFESKAYECAVVGRLGFSALLKGDLTGEAERLFSEARRIGDEARELGRSDETTYISELGWSLARATARQENGILEEKDIVHLESLVRSLLVLNQRNPESLAFQMAVAGLRGTWQLSVGQNPTDGILKALKAYDAFTAAVPASSSMKGDRIALYAVLSRQAIRAGSDPTPLFMEALKDPGLSNYRLKDSWCEILCEKAAWELAVGKSPQNTLNDLERALEMLRTWRNGRLESSYQAMAVEAKRNLYLARWAVRQGEPIDLHIKAAITAVNLCLQLNPNALPSRSLAFEIREFGRNNRGFLKAILAGPASFPSRP